MHSRCNHLDPRDGLHLGGEGFVSVQGRLFPEYARESGPVNKTYVFLDARDDLVLRVELMESDYLHKPRQSMMPVWLRTEAFPFPNFHKGQARTSGM
jgi:hypothetical protein